MFDLSGFPFHHRIQRMILKVLGPSLSAIRFYPAVSGLLALLALFLFVSSWSTCFPYKFAVILLGCDYVFFHGTHNSRPETFIWLVAILNLIWLFKGKRRSVGLALGGLAALSLGIHPAGIFLLIAFPVLLT